mgnify:CR=1 FL=1
MYSNIFSAQSIQDLMSVLPSLPVAIWETFYVTVVSTALSLVLGLPLGVLLVAGEKNGVLPLPRWLMQVINVIINLLRSIPFLILMIMVFPLSRLLIGTAVGTTATIVPLVAAAFPFVARLVESSLREVDGNIIEAAQSMGATPMQIICKVMIPESVPSLLQKFTIALTTILGYKFQYSAKGVVNIENITRLQFSSSIGNNIAFERVLGCFKDGNLGKLAVRLDELILYVRTRPYSSKTSIRRTFTELAVRVINIASDTGVDVDSILGQTNIYQWILEQNHTEILTEWFLKLCTELVALMSSQLHSSARDVIREATGYIDANLGSPDLGLATICEHIGLSPSYFSQLFKSETGKETA